MEVFVARHPIFDRDRKVCACELEFRSGFAHYYRTLGEDRALADLSAICDFEELTGGRKGLITITRDLLVDEFLSILPMDKVIVGMPEDICPEEDVVNVCRKLKRFGHVLVVSDYVLAHPDGQFVQMADFVRVDFAQTPPELRERICRIVSRYNVIPLARGVNTPEEFQQAVTWGYQCFQGGFFQKPDVSQGREIPANAISHVQLLKQLNQPEFSYDDMEEIIKRDVSLGYKLLKLVNSVCFGLRYEVNSIRHALVLLGPQEVRRWANVLSLRALGKDKPSELLMRSLCRAMLCEEVAGLLQRSDRSAELFLMGMFSMIDALLDVSMADALDAIPLNQDVRHALLGTPNDYRKIFDTIVAYEQGQWQQFTLLAAEIGLGEEHMPAAYKRAVKWANDALAMT